MFLLISVFVLTVMVCSGLPLGPLGMQNSKGAFVAAANNRGLHTSRMKRSVQSEGKKHYYINLSAFSFILEGLRWTGLAAEDYLLSGAETFQISSHSIVYTKPGGYNRAVADFEYLKPEDVMTTRWGKTGWTHFHGQVGDRTLILSVDDYKKAPVMSLTRINQQNGNVYTVYTQRFVYMSSKDLKNFKYKYYE